MVKGNPKAADPISAAPAEQQALLEWIRTLMRAKLEGVAEERLQNGMVVYGLEKRWLSGFGCRRKCAMFYLMDSKLLDLYADRLGTLRSGKSWVEFRESQSMRLNEVKAWAREAIEELRSRL
jgi:hypothetical protein